ncbi:hypothetical protein G6F65_021209 [Rhizopus arrhizus]|nr:hypothetical protein G6F65_021209 [Rhizopus arrhizus]
MAEAQRDVAGAADRVDVLIAQLEMTMDIGIPAVESVDHFSFIDEVPATLEVERAGLGQADFPSAAPEQLHSQIAFQSAHSAGERRRRNSQRRGGQAEIAPPRNFDKHGNVVQLYVRAERVG